MTNTSNPKTIILYHDATGHEPFTNWLNRLRDATTRRRILSRLRRLERGNYGDVKPVGTGVNELRFFFFRAGYRVYFGEHGDTLVVLLCGGDKSSQSRDIQQAQAYWQEYLSHV
jgi:putative addiction module killer protein